MPIKPNLSNKLFARGPKHLVVLIACLLIALLGLTKLTDYSRTISTIYYSQFLKLIEEKKIKLVHISGNNVYGTTTDDEAFETVIQQDPKNIELLRKYDVDFSVSPSTPSFNFWHFLLMGLLCSGAFALWYFLRPSKNSSGGGIFSFGKSKAKLFEPTHVSVSFDDVAGATEAKEEFRDIIDYLKNPEKYKRIGAKITRGVLLSGEPGNGKTLLAKAVAGEAQCSFYSITGSDFIEVFVGIGASRVRDMFNQARQNAPSIIFIDEIEVIGRQRGSAYPGGGHDEREQTLNQLLTEMDGFNNDGSCVIVIGATNMPDTLDKALLRPGRFDRKIEVPYPDLRAREEILTIHSKNLLMDAEVDLHDIAQTTAGFSGADLAQLINKAALYASKKENGFIGKEDLERAQQSMLSHEGSKVGTISSHHGKSHQITMYMPNQIKCNFSMVAGMPEVKQEVQDIIGFLKDPVTFGRLGAKISKGVLLSGKPGTGKTLLARAIAGEAHCPFFSISASEFIEVYVGTGAARVRELFVQARKYSPCIVFIDEIDSIGAKRQSEGSGGDGERYQTLNQLLVEMDGFQTNKAPIVVIAATNRPDILDPALKRPGRFDREIAIPLPFLIDREEILKTHAKNIVLSEEVDLYKIARATPQWSGAELSQLINEAALIATKNETQKEVQLKDFEEARDRLMMGHGLSSLRSTPEQRYSTALHEAGHALIGILVPHTDPLHKVTIAPRGQALGVTFYLPENDSLIKSKDNLLGDIMVSLGGRVAESLIEHGVNSGVHSDFERATQLAHSMVRHYGMSEKLGHVSYPAHNNSQYSETTAALIDQEVREIVEQCYTNVKALLAEHKDKLLKLAHALVEQETMNAQQVYDLLEMQPRSVFKFS